MTVGVSEVAKVSLAFPNSPALLQSVGSVDAVAIASAL